MNAGREMDAIVAEKIFGYEWEILDGDDVLCEPVVNTPYIRTYWPNRNTEFVNEQMDVLPYSTDIAAAFLVVDKLVEMGYYVDIGVDEHGAQVQLDKFEPNREVFWELGGSVRADTAPEAICRAALAAQDGRR